MPKYIANPVEVEAYRITRVGPVADRGGNFRVVTLETGTMVMCDEGMLARYVPVPGDYWVRQSDGYVYVNPKDVFERKYRAA